MERVADPVCLSEIIVNAIEALWAEMPRLFGDQWPSVEYKVANMLRRAYSELEISMGGSDQCRGAEVALLYSLFDLFSTSPRASDRFSEVLDSFVGPIPHLKSMEEPGEGSNRRPAD